MQIGIIADRLGLKIGGLETYERGLLDGLASIQSRHHYEVFGSSNESANAQWSATSQIRFQPDCVKSSWLRFSLGLPWSLRKRDLDLVHACFVPPLITPRRLITTIHDLGPFLHPHFLPWTINLRLRVLLGAAIRNSQKIIAVSEATRQDIINHFCMPPERIDVIHLGIDKQFCVGENDQLQSEQISQGFPEKYILYVGRIEPRKNISGLLQAYRWLKREKKIPHKLVIVGKIEPWGAMEISRNARYLDQDVIFPGYIPQAVLPQLYRKADVFVYPSLFEGFGLPPLEAMACGTPVVASRLPVTCEVLGDAALLVDAHDVMSIAAGIYQILDDPAMCHSLCQLGLQKASTYTWRTTAEKTVRLYEEFE